MVDTTSKMCITDMFVIVYLHAFHIKCAGMFINHLHTTFHMPCSKLFIRYHSQTEKKNFIWPSC